MKSHAVIQKKDTKSEEFVQAVLANDETAVATLLALGANPNCKNSLGITPLLAACENGNAALVCILLDAGADPNVPVNGNCPLRAAILSGDGEVINNLVKGKADVNLETSRGTPLITAAGEGDAETISLLLDNGAEVNYQTRDGMTALVAAVRDNRQPAVRLLLQKGADPNQKSQDTGRSAIDIAQDKDLPEVYSLLLQAAIMSSADQTMADSEKRQQQAHLDREQSMKEEVQKLQVAAAESRAQVSTRVSELRAEKEELMKRLGLVAR